MKKISFATAFIAVHILFIVLHITKRSMLIGRSFRKQKNELSLATLKEKKQAVQNRLHTAHDLRSIKAFAQDELQMKPIGMNQIKRLPTS